MRWLTLVVALTIGCSFDRRSPSLACTVPGDCSGGRTCVDGWCVESAGGPDGAPDGLIVDADPLAPDAPPVPDAGPFDAFVCPPGCSMCEGDLCKITCVTGSEPRCSGVVTCPAGYKCKVECQGAGTCALGVDCSGGQTCRIECTGTDSCDGMVTCGAGPCIIECQSNSCNGGIDCSASCMCMPACGSGSCVPEPVCPAGCDQGSSCKFTGAGCTCF
jgi:hypothetical protein